MSPASRLFTQENSMASDQSIRIRMYCQGLGDCFLLTFPRSGGERPEFHFLIDCGVIAGTQDGAEIVQAVVEDIFATTGGHLDLVAATHEHWDHVSGFNQARARFAQFTIDAVWLGWTEDPKDPKDLIKNRAAKIKAVRAAAKKIAEGGLSNAGVAENHRRIREVLSFFGDESEDSNGALGVTDQGGAIPNARTTRDALDFLARHPRAAVTFCYPSKPPLTLPGVDGVRVYVFGPPEDVAYLKMSNPTRAAKTYGVAAQGGEESFIAALSADGEDPLVLEMQDLTYPFESEYRIPEEQIGQSVYAQFFDEHYGLKPEGSEAWRRIDLDWLDVTSELALNLDSDTNNTSLVLAFEIGEPGQGRVLLFAADAQVGNWLSWKDLKWTFSQPSETRRTVSAHDLLARAVLYKVGHHGSHNATLSELGLELMNSPDLVALLPVDKKMALKKGWGEMPFDPLLETLAEKTRGRIIRIDDPGLPERPGGARLNEDEWRTFQDALRVHEAEFIENGQKTLKKLYVEYYLDL